MKLSVIFLENVNYKLTPVQNGWEVFITWDRPATVPNKYIVYITEPTGSRFTVVDGYATSFTEIVTKCGIYQYKIKAVYDDKEIYSRLITVEIGCCCPPGGYNVEEEPIDNGFVWFQMYGTITP